MPATNPIESSGNSNRNNVDTNSPPCLGSRLIKESIPDTQLLCLLTVGGAALGTISGLMMLVNDAGILTRDANAETWLKYLGVGAVSGMAAGATLGIGGQVLYNQFCLNNTHSAQNLPYGDEPLSIYLGVPVPEHPTTGEILSNSSFDIPDTPA